MYKALNLDRLRVQLTLQYPADIWLDDHKQDKTEAFKRRNDSVE